MPKKHPPSQVDKAIKKLTPEQLEEWNKLCKFNATYRELAEFLNTELGETVSAMSLSRWWRLNRPRGQQAVSINALAEHWGGTDPQIMLEFSAGVCAKIDENLYYLLDSETLEAASVGSRLANITELLKELRQASHALKETETRDDQEQIRMAGAYEMAKLLTDNFKGTPFEEALDTGIQAALQEIKESS
jgi:hypothetical protein